MVLCVGCSNSSQANSSTPARTNNQKTICEKENAITQAKSLLQITDLYFFDCDFSHMESIVIEDVSYNLCVSGYILTKDDKKYMDLNQQVIMYIVTNYKIQAADKCFGFSVVASVLISKMDHYVNGEFSYTNPNEIYTQYTYSSIKELHNNGAGTSQGNIGVEEIEVPKNFYPVNSLYDAVSLKSNYLKIEGDINSPAPIKIIDTPIKLIAHYANYEDSKSMSENSTAKNLITYFTNNAVYTKF